MRRRCLLLLDVSAAKTRLQESSLQRVFTSTMTPQQKQDSVASDVTFVTGYSTPSKYVADDQLFQKVVRETLDPAMYTRQKKSVLTSKIQQLQTSIKELESTRSLIEEKVRRSSNSFLFANFGFLAAQFALLFNWVFFTFDWNLVEPVTYFLGYTVVWAGLVFYSQTGRSFSYDDIIAVLEERRRAKLCSKLNFDYDKYNSLVQELEDAQNELQKY